MALKRWFVKTPLAACALVSYLSPAASVYNVDANPLWSLLSVLQLLIPKSSTSRVDLILPTVISNTQKLAWTQTYLTLCNYLKSRGPFQVRIKNWQTQPVTDSLEFSPRAHTTRLILVYSPDCFNLLHNEEESVFLGTNENLVIDFLIKWSCGSFYTCSEHY